MIELREYSEIQDQSVLQFCDAVHKNYNSEEYKTYIADNFDDLVYDKYDNDMFGYRPDATYYTPAGIDVDDFEKASELYTHDIVGMDALIQFSVDIVDELCHTHPETVKSYLQQHGVIPDQMDDSWIDCLHDVLYCKEAKETVAYKNLEQLIKEFEQDGLYDIYAEPEYDDYDSEWHDVVY